jgi:chitodextrinase
MSVLAIMSGIKTVFAQSSIPSTLGWYQIPNTKLSTVCPPNTYPACLNVVRAWSSGVFDSQRNRMIIWGGGHGDYSGNEIYAVNMNGTPSVQRLTNPTAGGCSASSCDGGLTPNSRHTYGGLDYMANLDRMFVFGGSAAGSGFLLKDTWTYSFTGSKWEQRNPNPNVAYNFPGISAYDPNSGKVFLTDGVNLYRYDWTNDRYDLVSSPSTGSSDSMTGVVDPKRQKLLIIGVGNVFMFDISSGSNFAAQKISTTGATSIVGTRSPGLAYDPVTDRIVAWNGGDTVYSLNLDTRAWTSVTYSGGPGAAQSNGTYGRWRYSPALNVFVLVNDMDQNVYTFRLSNGTPPPADTQAPTTPTNLSANAISTSQINLSWTASTDDTGVTGYRVERCSGSGCTNFSEIGVATDTSYSNTGLAASTTYQYRIRATDAAGNLSSYSATAGARTQDPVTNPVSGVLQVGPGKTYSTIASAVAAAQDGNTIEIDAGVYPNEYMTISKSVTLRGVGGLAHLKWGTGNYLTNTSTIPNGKGILIIQGSNVTIENLEFSGAKVVDENGAGIRYQSGNLTIRNSYFHQNENGILGEGGSSATLLIEFSTFDNNGYCLSACAHNIYIGFMGTLIFRHNRSVNPHEGHALKSRASVNQIISNYLSTKNSDGSYEAEFPNGGTVYFVGNVIEQGANTDNSTILAYGFEGATNPNPALYVVNNTFFSFRSPAGTYIQVSGSPALTIKNNIFGSDSSGTILGGGSTDLSSNKTLTSSTFVSAANSDYHLVSGSPAIDAGVAPGTAGTFDLTPQWEYVDPANRTARNIVGAIDAGAYEFGSSTTSVPPVLSGITASSLTSSGATIQWATDKASSSQVEYGLTTAYGSQTSLDNSMVLSHSQSVSGLQPATTYNYRVKSRDTSGNLATSSNFTFTTASSTTPPPPPPVSPDGLIGYWKFDEGAGTVAVDSAGTNPGTLINGPVWTTGKIGQALQFNATDNGNYADDPRVVIGRNFDVVLPFTFSAWVNPADFADYRAIFSKRDSSTSSDRRVDVGLWKTSGQVYVMGSQIIFGYAPPVQSWTHLTIVATSTATQLYVNGALQQTLGPAVLGASSTANTVIGGTGEPTDPFKGFIDEVRVYNRALSASEVQGVYAYTPATDSVPPVISNVVAGDLTSIAAAIQWTTDKASDSQVEYGLTTAYGSQTTLNTTMVTSHAQSLFGLLPSTTYNYRVKSKDGMGNIATSSNFTFTTLPDTSTPPADLIGYWKLDDGSGMVATDSAGLDPGALVNNPRWMAGKIGGALQFNATDNGVGTDDPRVVLGSKLVLTVPFSFSAWINPADFKDYRAIFSKRDKALASLMQVEIGLSKNNGKVYISTPSLLTFSYSPTRNKWTHLAIVATTTDTQLYVNGALQQTLGPIVLGTGTTANAAIGGTGEASGNDPFKGVIDEVRLYNNALSSAAVRDVYYYTGTTNLEVVSNTIAGTDAQQAETVSVTYARARSQAGAAVDGIAVIAPRSGENTVSETAIPASAPIRNGRIYINFNGPVNTGLAIANDEDVPALISFHFTDGSGNDFGHGAFTLEAKHNLAAFVNQPPFNLSGSMEGTLTFESSTPVAVAALRGLTNERGEFLMTALPVGSVGSDTDHSFVVVPQYADGGGWSTQVVLVNPTDSTLMGTAHFFDSPSAGSGASGSDVNYTIAPRSVARLVRSNSTPDVHSGYVVVTAAANHSVPQALSILSFSNNGITVSETGVSSAPADTAFHTYVEATGSVRSAVAIVNSSASAVRTKLELVDLSGVSTGLTALLDIPARAHVAGFLDELFTKLPVGFQGVLRIASAQPVVAASLLVRNNERGEMLMTSVPIVSGTTPANNTVLVFPIIVTGGGYSTEFVGVTSKYGN